MALTHANEILSPICASVSPLHSAMVPAASSSDMHRPGGSFGPGSEACLPCKQRVGGSGGGKGDAALCKWKGDRAAFPAADLEEACSARIAWQLRRGEGPRVGREGKRNGRLPLTEGTNASLSTQVSKKYSSQQHRVCVCV